MGSSKRASVPQIIVSGDLKTFQERRALFWFAKFVESSLKLIQTTATVVTIKAVRRTPSRRAIACVTFDLADRNHYRIEVSKRHLKEWDDAVMRRVAAHEVLHIAFYHYARLAEHLVGKRSQRLLVESEEQLISRIEQVVADSINFNVTENVFSDPPKRPTNAIGELI